MKNSKHTTKVGLLNPDRTNCGPQWISQAQVLLWDARDPPVNQQKVFSQRSLCLPLLNHSEALIVWADIRKRVGRCCVSRCHWFLRNGDTSVCRVSTKGYTTSRERDPETLSSVSCWKLLFYVHSSFSFLWINCCSLTWMILLNVVYCWPLLTVLCSNPTPSFHFSLIISYLGIKWWNTLIMNK